MPIDWETLARRVHALESETDEGTRVHVGDVETRRALTILLGEDTVRAAVRHAVSLEVGAALAASVVATVRGPVASDECTRLYREATEESVRVSAIRLLNDAGDATVVPFLMECSRVPSADLRTTAAWVAYKLAMGSTIDREDALAILVPLSRDPDGHVRTQAVEFLVAVRALGST